MIEIFIVLASLCSGFTFLYGNARVSVNKSMDENCMIIQKYE